MYHILMIHLATVIQARRDYVSSLGSFLGNVLLPRCAHAFLATPMSSLKRHPNNTNARALSAVSWALKHSSLLPAPAPPS